LAVWDRAAARWWFHLVIPNVRVVASRWRVQVGGMLG